MAAVIRLSGVTKAFERVPAVADLDLEVPSGKTTVLIGPSGCGKSTVLRLILGLVLPDAGTVECGGTRMSAATAAALRRRMGYVVQSGGLFPHLTARQNVTLVAEELGWEAERCVARVDELAALTRFPKGGLDRYPSELSGGQRQRVGLMRALALDPEVLLLDEPLGALDPMIRADLQKDLRDVFVALGKTAVVVTHDLAEAGFFADRVVLMRGGSIAQEGEFRALLREPSSDFVAAFVRAHRTSLEDLVEDRP